MSKLIPAATAENESAPPPAPASAAPTPVAADFVAKAIEREAARDPSDPFLAKRLWAHYRQGVWYPEIAKKDK